MKNDGILITHGTDTLAWTHAYLRYAIKNNNVNIVITGSQIPIPSIGEFSDAYENLENSLRFITGLKPPNIITVFNYGKDAFSDSLRKIHRWDNIAFTGDVVAKMEWDEIKHHDETIEIKDPEVLDTLYLVTTGGTIESEPNSEGVLVASENHVFAYLGRKFSSFFKAISQQPVFVLDSSDITFNRMMAIGEKVVECLQEKNKNAKIDYKFDDNVSIIYLDPLKKIHLKEHDINTASGVIIAGYGGGNINIDNKDPKYNVIPLLKKLIENEVPVVLTSQVALGPADFIYQNAYEALKIGAISGVDLSIPEIQIRLAYLLGHKAEIKELAKELNKHYLWMFEWIFVTGTKFRTRRSLALYQNLKKMDVLKEDILINKTFDETVDYIKKIIL